MMDVLSTIFTAASQLPPVVSIVVGGFGVVVAGWIYYRKVQLEERVAASSIQKIQIKSLLEQIEMLSSDLILARHEMRQLHDQNVKLMVELREANQRISAMESTLNRRRRWNDDPSTMPTVGELVQRDFVDTVSDELVSADTVKPRSEQA